MSANNNSPESTTSNSAVLDLPATAEELKSFFKNLKVSQLVTLLQSKEIPNLTEVQKLVGEYSGAAMLAGRPLDSVLILLVGETGAGKSTTINVLFEDDELCETSGTTSTTKECTLLKKLLSVPMSGTVIRGYLGLIDVPGTHDTTSGNESSNFASIKKLKKSLKELEDRTNFYLKATCVRKKVYPNIVLFVVDATDKRMDGNNAVLLKNLQTFRKSQYFIDPEKSNVIVTLTNVASLGCNKNTFERKLEPIMQVLRKQVRLVLGIKDVQIVPIENKPEDYDLEKVGDFYRLPNGEMSHLNLFHAMQKIFQTNQDTLGQLLTSHYFASECPDKAGSVLKIPCSVGTPSQEEINAAIKDLKEIKIITDDEVPYFPTFVFRNLLHGYCPVTENVKPAVSLQFLGDFKVCRLEKLTLQIPKEIEICPTRRNQFRRCSRISKEEYEEAKIQSYGLDAGVKLYVSANAEGRWIITESTAGKSASAVVSLEQEFQLATVFVKNPRKQQLSKEILGELDKLPSTYTPQNASRYNAFFSKWGTHVITGGNIGGTVQMNCEIERTQQEMIHNQLAKIDAEVSGMFNAIYSANAEFSFANASQELKQAGVSKEFLKIEGGDPPFIGDLNEEAAIQLRQWVSSISQNPAELNESLKLYPYYNFVPPSPGHRRESLLKATEDYLANKLSTESKTNVSSSRNQQAADGVSNAKNNAKSSSWCFPAGSYIMTENGTSTQIELLQNTSIKLKTLDVNKANNMEFPVKALKCKLTNFCTFLHHDEDSTAEYMILQFDNGNTLKASPDHLIFEYLPDSYKLTEKQAKHFKIGNSALYYNNELDKWETPKLKQVSTDVLSGIYCPLTTTGTLIVDGFYVSSYADVQSFRLADHAMLPLKIWHCLYLNKIFSAFGYNSVPGIHIYAQMLMMIRQTGRCILSKMKNQ